MLYKDLDENERQELLDKIYYLIAAYMNSKVYAIVTNWEDCDVCKGESSLNLVKDGINYTAKCPFCNGGNYLKFKMVSGIINGFNIKDVEDNIEFHFFFDEYIDRDLLTTEIVFQIKNDDLDYIKNMSNSVHSFNNEDTLKLYVKYFDNKKFKGPRTAGDYFYNIINDENVKKNFYFIEKPLDKDYKK